MNGLGSNQRKLWRSLSLVTVGAVASILVLVLSPLILLFVSRILSKEDWNLLSNVGQSYTGPATLLTAGALAGVVWTGVLQTRQLQASRHQAVRELQIRLLDYSMQDPELAYLFTDSPFQQKVNWSHENFRMTTLINMWLRYTEFGYLSGAFSEGQIREFMRDEMFVSRLMRDQARRALPAWSRADPAVARLIDILVEELEIARQKYEGKEDAAG